MTLVIEHVSPDILMFMIIQLKESSSSNSGKFLNAWEEYSVAEPLVSTAA